MEKRIKKVYPNQHKPWAQEELNIILTHVNPERKYDSFEVIAPHLGRSTQAVLQQYYTKLYKMERLPMDIEYPKEKPSTKKVIATSKHSKSVSRHQKASYVMDADPKKEMSRVQLMKKFKALPYSEQKHMMLQMFLKLLDYGDE